MEEGRSAIIEIGRDTATTSSSSIIAAWHSSYRKGGWLGGLSILVILSGTIIDMVGFR